MASEDGNAIVGFRRALCRLAAKEGVDGTYWHDKVMDVTLEHLMGELAVAWQQLQDSKPPDDKPAVDEA